MQQENPTPQDEAANQEQEQTETPNVDVVPDMQEALQTAERKAQEHYDAWMYAKAEGENIRRRAMDDIDKARKYAL